MEHLLILPKFLINKLLGCINYYQDKVYSTLLYNLMEYHNQSIAVISTLSESLNKINNIWDTSGTIFKTWDNWNEALRYGNDILDTYVIYVNVVSSYLQNHYDIIKFIDDKYKLFSWISCWLLLDNLPEMHLTFAVEWTWLIWTRNSKWKLDDDNVFLPVWPKLKLESVADIKRLKQSDMEKYLILIEKLKLLQIQSISKLISLITTLDNRVKDIEEELGKDYYTAEIKKALEKELMEGNSMHIDEELEEGDTATAIKKE